MGDNSNQICSKLFMINDKLSSINDKLGCQIKDTYGTYDLINIHDVFNEFRERYPDLKNDDDERCYQLGIKLRSNNELSGFLECLQEESKVSFFKVFMDEESNIPTLMIRRCDFGKVFNALKLGFNVEGRGIY